MFKVIHKFKDLEDNNHIYSDNDIYPYDLKDVSFERIKELASKNNKIGTNLIKKLNMEELKNIADKLSISYDNEKNIENVIKENIPHNFNLNSIK